MRFVHGARAWKPRISTSEESRRRLPILRQPMTIPGGPSGATLARRPTSVIEFYNLSAPAQCTRAVADRLQCTPVLGLPLFVRLFVHVVPEEFELVAPVVFAQVGPALRQRRRESAQMERPD